MPDAADMTSPADSSPRFMKSAQKEPADIILFPANGRHQLQQRRKILIVPRPERIRRCLEKASYFIHHTGHLDVSAKRKRKDLPETDFIQRRRPYSDLECRRPVVLLPERIQKVPSNVFKRNLDGSNEKQLTQHTKHPVRFLSAASNGTLCYGYDGEIYTVKEGEKPHK